MTTLGMRIARDITYDLGVACFSGVWQSEFILYKHRHSDEVLNYVREKYPDVQFDVYGSDFGASKDIEIALLSTSNRYFM